MKLKGQKTFKEGWDVSDEAVQKSMEIIPLLPLSKTPIGDRVVFVSTTNEPETINYINKETKEQDFFKVMHGYEIVGDKFVECNLPVGSMSLQLALKKVLSQHSSIIGLPLEILVVQIDYKLGANRGYMVSVVNDQQKLEIIKKMPLKF